MYTPGSRPPSRYSAAGAAKYIHTPAAINTAGSTAVQFGRGAVAPRRTLPRDASARAAASAALHHTSPRREYALIAASTNATVVVTMMLMMTDQNRRSSAGNAARFGRSAIGIRKMTAPGRYAIAISDAMVFSIVRRRSRNPRPLATSCDGGTRIHGPACP